MKACSDCQRVPAATDVVDDAEGVETAHWYAAIVNHNSEKISADKLTALGYMCYVASQREVRIWRNGRRAQVDRILIPSIVFIRCTESERQEIVRLPFVFRFMTNKASTMVKSVRSVAIIPDVQMAQLQFMLGHSDGPVEIVDRIYGCGDRVRVTRGSLRGLEGEVIISKDGRNEILIRLDILGCAKVTIDPQDVEPAI